MCVGDFKTSNKMTIWLYIICRICIISVKTVAFNVTLLASPYLLNNKQQ